MKKMIQMAVMAAAMFVVVSTHAQAQGGGGGGQGRGGGRSVTTILKDSLKVSDAIVAKADSIQKAYNEKNASLSQAARGGDADARTKLMQSRQEMNAEIKKLLTPEQATKFDAIMSAGRRGGGGH
jgi:Spy/CpxP family protein refolding chaperone